VRNETWFQTGKTVFCWEPTGRKNAAILSSPTSTCRRHDVDPHLHLTQLLLNLAQVRMSELHNWSPDKWKQLQKARLQ
jgi:hypothetical protein